MSKDQNKGESFMIKVLSFIIIVSVSLNIILIFKRTEVFPTKKELITSNEVLNKNLSKYRSEINKYKGITTKIDQVISDANIKIEAKEKELLAIKRSKKVKEKENEILTFQLDSLQEQYLSVIDSLLVEREQTRIVNNRIESLEDIIRDLNKKIGLASYLSGDNLKVSPIKKSFTGKYNPSVLAKNVVEINICMDVLENKLANKGLKNIYFVINSPNAEIILDKAEESPEFFHPDYKIKARYSKAESIKYANQKVNVCAKIVPSSPLVAGLYVIEVFSDENKLGTTTFTLR